MPQAHTFADANADFEESKFVILGAPFDRTSSYRAGSRFAPNAIREASHNLESYIMEHGIDLCDIPIHDAGNLEEFGTTAQMCEEVEFAVREIILKKSKFMVMLGGEHSITPPAVKAFREYIGPISVLALDAHLDFRSEYLGESNSHACALRRNSEIVGMKNVASIGVRSMSGEESDDVGKTKLNYISAYEVAEMGIDACLRKAVKSFGKNGIYLTLDIDCIDPAYAPGTGTPEPFGLLPMDVKKAIGILAPRLIGFDLVEVCPPYDNGNTSVLAARFARDVIATVWKARKRGKRKSSW